MGVNNFIVVLMYCFYFNVGELSGTVNSSNMTNNMNSTSVGVILDGSLVGMEGQDSIHIQSTSEAVKKNDSVVEPPAKERRKGRKGVQQDPLDETNEQTLTQKNSSAPVHNVVPSSTTTTTTKTTTKTTSTSTTTKPTSTSAKPHNITLHKKPLFTMIITDKESTESESFIESSTTGKDFVFPIVLTILLFPLILVLIRLIYKRGTQYTERQQYHRMYLIDGMYNSR
jgi:hypothetical protein